MSRTVAALTLTLVGLCSAGCGILGTKSYRVPSAGMEPTLPVGSHVSADTGQRRPKVGDIVVFHPPTSATSPEGECPPGRRPDAHGRPCATIGVEDRSVTFIKRVVARGGDTIALRGGRVVLSGRVHSPVRLDGRMRLPASRAGSRRRVLPARRQSWQLRRQPLLGRGPAELDHRHDRALRASRIAAHSPSSRRSLSRSSWGANAAATSSASSRSSPLRISRSGGGEPRRSA